uniref:Nuclear receptor domain-containing protein n=1 Tax=Panagrellus redivivus TaxID=6233 RepID=A0A7E4VZ55_PANRE
MKVPAFKPVEIMPYSVSTTQAPSPQMTISAAPQGDGPDSTPGMAQCVMCDAKVASIDTDVYLCGRCFPIDPTGDGELD